MNKAMLFGLALLCALPGCCGWCKKKECKEERPKKECGMKCKEGREGRKNGMKDKKDNMK